MKKIIMISIIIYVIGTGVSFAQTNEQKIETAPTGVSIPQELETALQAGGKKVEENNENVPLENVPQPTIDSKKNEFVDYRDANPFHITFDLASAVREPKRYDQGYGVSIGAQLNRYIYIGLYGQVGTRSEEEDNENYSDSEADSSGSSRRGGRGGRGTLDDDGTSTTSSSSQNESLKIFGQSDGEITDYEEGRKGLLEFRVYPWSAGLFFSIGAMYYEKDSTSVEYSKTSRILNGNQYNTGLEATVEFEEQTVPTVGLGYSHTFSSGLTLMLGATANIYGEKAPDVVVKAVDADATVAQADLDKWAEEIVKDNSQDPYIFTAGFGIAF